MAARCLSCGVCSECLMCVEACGVKAIDHEMRETARELDVGAVQRRGAHADPGEMSGEVVPAPA